MCEQVLFANHNNRAGNNKSRCVQNLTISEEAEILKIGIIKLRFFAILCQISKFLNTGLRLLLDKMKYQTLSDSAEQSP